MPTCDEGELTDAQDVFRSDDVHCFQSDSADIAVREQRSDDALKYSATSAYVRTIVSGSLQDCFVAMLPSDPRIRAVFWNFEGAMLRVWTLVKESDFDFERSVYAAEAAFMRKFDKVQCDFYVVYQDDREIDDLKPLGATQVFPKSEA